MKESITELIVLILLFLIIAAAMPSTDKKPDEYNAPVIQIDDVTYQAEFTDKSGKVYRVTFYIGETLDGNLQIRNKRK